MKELSDARPWGKWVILDQAPGYKVKRIEILPGRRVSLQKHRRRSERWTIVQGAALVICGKQTMRLKAGQSCAIARGCPHRIANRGRSKLVFIEVQTGGYLGEDDIVRLEDDYGRI
ncbi:MAG: phosphomannose isomerase type II C-terminal cupin domain [Elusimicrobia bacterium]|nr:phosphomannose isomerase type II C-terminal cupin domain [Elusimicrobiota bacterium]